MALHKALVEEIDEQASDFMEEHSNLPSIPNPIISSSTEVEGIIFKEAAAEEKKLKADFKLCELCQDALSNYQCPKCRIFYCSLKCYKSQFHLKCSEAFFKKEIDQHLSTLSLEESYAKKNKMMKTLKRMYASDMEEDFHLYPEATLNSPSGEDEDSNEDEDIGLMEKFQGQNIDELDCDEIWAKLDKSHQDNFTHFLEFSRKKDVDVDLRHAKLNSILPILEPWWLCTDADSKNFYSAPLYVEIPSVQLPKKVHPSVGLSLLNALFAYSITYRVLAGELSTVDKSNLCLDMIIDLAPSLLPPNHHNSIQFATLEELFFHTIQMKPALSELRVQPKEAFILGWRDVIAFTTVPCIIDESLPPSSDKVVLALSQLYLIFDGVSTSSKVYRLTCEMIRRKIAFLFQYHKANSTLALYNKPQTHCRIEELIKSILD